MEVAPFDNLRSSGTAPSLSPAGPAPNVVTVKHRPSMSENRQPVAADHGILPDMELLDREACYRAFQGRDARFDGRVFVGVTSTGIYCRPVCPARAPKFENCRFFASAAAAQEAGFRPCLRCRPEIAPELAFWRGSSNTVSRALRLIAEGALDENEAGVEALAERLGVGGRQLRRLFSQHLGASPIAVAQTRRVLFAKQLLHDTRLPMTEVALSAGFGSVRRFNETFRTLFGRPPSALRRARNKLRGSGPAHVAGDAVTLWLSYRPPYDWPGMLDALAARANRKVERVERGVWHRTIELDGSTGSLAAIHVPERNAIAVTIAFPEVRALPAIVARVKRVFDLGADIATIGSHLARDPRLAPLIARRPGLRAPGDWDRDDPIVLDGDAPPAWRPWHAYAEQHLRMAGHA